MSSYVINLERRKDRLVKFNNNYSLYGPNAPLTVFKAIDGTTNDYLSDPYLKFIGQNDFGSSPRVICTILSHIHIWNLIAEGMDEYGFVFEDDIIFREDAKFRTLYKSYNYHLEDLLRESEKELPIIYFGAGDILPIHIPIPSHSLLKALEMSHITEDSIRHKFFGSRRATSPYLFDWLGAFSYVMPRKTARYLFDKVLKESCITKAVDVYLKDIFSDTINPSSNNNGLIRYISAPLLTYHSSYDLNIYDSDTWGISVPTDYIPETEPTKITFIIPSGHQKMSLERVLDNIFELESESESESYGVEVSCIVCPKDQATFEFVRYSDRERVDVLSTINRTDVDCINNGILLASVQFNPDFYVIWDSTTVFESSDWKQKFMAYKQIVNKEGGPCCLQLRRKNTWDFSSIMMNKSLIDCIGKIKCPNVLGFIKYISYLSKINVVVRDILTEKISSKGDEIVFEEDYETLRNSLVNDIETKKTIDNTISIIKESNNYSACGIWIDYPKGWFESDIIGTNELVVFNKKTV